MVVGTLSLMMRVFLLVSLIACVARATDFDDLLNKVADLNEKWDLMNTEDLAAEVAALNERLPAHQEQASRKLQELKSCRDENILKMATPKLDQILKYTKPNPKPTSCADVLKNNPGAKSGMYDLFPGGTKINLKCEMSKNGGGWTRFLQLNGATKSGCGNFKDVPLTREIVGAYCQGKEYTFSRSMMLKSKHELLFTDDQGRMMWYRFDNCAKGSCTCDKASDKGMCFYLAVTADYSGGRPLINDAGQDFDMWSEAYDWNQKRWENQGDGQCGGSNANAHSQFNCEPVREKNLGQCGQRWHYGTRHDGSHKGGSVCGGGGAGCAWNWYTGLATGWRGGCTADKAAWMISGPKANGQKRTAEVWFR